MAVVRIKGLKKVTRRLADGRRQTYWYAWAGGPRLAGAPGSPEFFAAYQAATAERRQAPRDTLAALVATYRASPEYAAFAASTRAQWSRWLDRIASAEGDHALGGYLIAAFDDRRVKADILDWRDQWAHAPRTADYAMQVLSAVLSHAVQRGQLAINAAAGIGKLYAADRSDQIWTPEEIAAFEAAAKNPEVAVIIPLACLTGLRREDLTRLTWANVGDTAIVVPTCKSGGRLNAVIPLLAETRALLDRIRARQAAAGHTGAHVLTTSFGKPWSPSGLTHAVRDAGIPKRLHDARGTFATRLRMAGLPASKIADVMGWEETRVQRILSVYVDRDAIVRDIARTLARKMPGKRRG